MANQPQQFQFRDSRQKQVYQDLQLFGHGPAAFFRDACQLMETEHGLESCTHLVAHLMREVTGAVIEVLVPPDIDLPTEGTYAAKIKAVLDRLEFKPTDFVTHFSTCNLQGSNAAPHRLAHRDSLRAPRRRDAAFDEYWEELQEFLSRLLDRAKDRFLELSLPWERLAEAEPTRRAITDLKTRLPHHPIFLNRFFDRLQDPKWLKPLALEGYFDNPPDAVQTESGLQFPGWAQSRFLLRMDHIPTHTPPNTKDRTDYFSELCTAFEEDNSE